MRSSQNERHKHKLKLIQTSSESLKNNLQSMHTCWIKNLEVLENSLTTMRDELFLNAEGREVSITGQILMESAAERAAKLTREVSDHHKTLHVSLSKVGKYVERNFDHSPSTLFKNEIDLIEEKSSRELGISMIYDYCMCNGFNKTGEALKKDSIIDEKYDVKEPDTLKQIVVDLHDGDIGSSMEYLETTRPEEQNLRRSLQTQAITDCIESGLENYERTIRQLKRFKSPFGDDKKKALRLVGALLIGKASMDDARYKELFDYTNRELLALKMASFFVPYEAPLKNLMRYGFKAMSQLTELFNIGYGGNVETELPLETSFNGSHSAFTCPILKEQCNSDNPPMRLQCGHVISRDAITRLTTSQRIRSNQRQNRFKCPYCPKEQFVGTAKTVDFRKWVPNDINNEAVRVFTFFN